MKRIGPFIIIVMIVIACNNAAENTEARDSTNVDVNTRTNIDTAKDTSSYERLSNKTKR